MQSEDGKSFVMADLFDITLLSLGWPRDTAGNGMTLRYCTTEYDIPWASNVYQGGYTYAGQPDHDPAPRIERGVVKTTIGTEVGTMSLSILLDGTELLPPAATGATQFGLAEAIGAGLFEGAHVRATRLFLSNHPTYPLTPASFAAVLQGGLTLFAGQVTETKLTRSKADLTVSSYMVKTNIGFPLRVFQPTCLNTLYDKQCTFSRTANVTAGGPPVTASARHDGTVGISIAPTMVLVPVTGASALTTGFFELGTLQMTSGPMAGVQRPIREWVNAFGAQYAFLLTPLPRVPVSGDGVRLQVGCSKDEATCISKFNNLANFAGQPRIPPADTST